MSVRIETAGPVWTVIIDRPAARNAVDGPTAQALADAFRAFDEDGSAAAAVLTGAGGIFCAGADLKQMSNHLDADPSADGPMGPSRLVLTKPVIAAIAGHAVAGGLELAAWCDLRVMESDAVIGVFCRRWGVPLIDGGTVRLPRIVGLGRALDLILTGRAVGAEEALAAELAAFPQACLRSDRRSAYDSLGADEPAALAREFELGMASLRAEGVAGAERFRAGEGRHGAF